MPRRSPWLFLLGVLGLLVAVPLGWWFAGRGEPPPLPAVQVAPGEPTALPAKLAAELKSLAGTVEIKRAGASWRPANRGDLIEPSDRIRTGDGSWAVLTTQDTWQVRMEAGTEVEMSELSSGISKLMLESGMAKATVRGGRHVFEVRAAKSDAVARMDQSGEFTVATNGEGTVALGAQTGEVQFIGKGRVVIVRAGQQSIIRPGQEPTAPAPIPKSLLLKVALPDRDRVRTKKLKVAGQAEPGALVEVDGKVVTPKPDGRFEATVVLDEGKNTVDVHARSVGHLDARSQHAIELDSQVRRTTIDKNLWAPKK